MHKLQRAVLFFFCYKITDLEFFRVMQSSRPVDRYVTVLEKLQITYLKIEMEDETLELTWWLSFVAHSKLAPVYIEQKSYIPSKTGLKDKQNKQIKQKTWQYCGEDSISTSHLQRWRHREVWWSWQCCWGWFAARSWCMAPNENDTCRAQTPCKVCTPVKQNRLFSNAED